MGTSGAATSQQLVFSCGDVWYGVPSDAVQEVVHFGELTRVPGAPAHVLGVFSLRGEVFPVIDVSLLRGGRGERSRRAVVLRLERGVLALTAGRLGGVSSVIGDLLPAGDTGPARCFLGPGLAQDHEVWVVDAEALFELLAP
ncbi:MAG: chemotaxis protein CheW [Myxococcaceae bacterium]|nr:chemotaxis protein CheW [Myxococcaceae bacterium]MCI0673950.1 chemotaxis protein CheW [Myxococcaceae bacterium]